MNETSNKVLRAEQITKRFGGLIAVNKIDFTIPAQGIVSLKLHHWPDDHSQRGNSLFGQWELGQQIWIDAFPRFISGKEIIAEGLDHMIEGNPNVRDLWTRQHHQQASQEAKGSTDLASIRRLLRRSTEVISEQLIRAIYQVDLHLRQIPFICSIVYGSYCFLSVSQYRPTIRIHEG